MAGLFLSLLHPPGSSPSPCEGWPTSEGTPRFPEVEGSSGGKDRDSVACHWGQGKVRRGGSPSWESRHGPGFPALVAALGSGISLLPLEPLQATLATGTLRLRSALTRFPFPWQLLGSEGVRSWGRGRFCSWPIGELCPAFEVLLVSVPNCLYPGLGHGPFCPQTSVFPSSEWAQNSLIHPVLQRAQREHRKAGAP